MGHKVNPVGFRIGVFRNWNSRWYAEKEYSTFLLEDIELRKYLITECDKLTLTSHVEIDRKKNVDGSYKVVVSVFVRDYGKIKGENDTLINKLKKQVYSIVSKGKKYKVFSDLRIVGVDNPNLDANIVAKDIARKLENRGSFRQIQKFAIKNVKAAGAKGVRTLVGGRLGGADIARNEGYKDGIIPLHTLKSDIDFAHCDAVTTYGRLGVKVWICRGNFKTKEEIEAERENFEKNQKDKDTRPKFFKKRNNPKGGNE